MIQPARRSPTGPWLLVAALALTACNAHTSALGLVRPATEPSTTTVPPTRGTTTTSTVPATWPPTPPATDAPTTTLATPAAVVPAATETAGSDAVSTGTLGADAATTSPSTVATDTAPPTTATPTAPPTTAAADTAPPTTAGPAVKSGANVNADPAIGDPISISIPSIGVESLLVPTGELPDGTMAVPKDASIAGWFTGGPKPGERGPAVIMGHLDQKTTGPGVFWHLRDLQIGAEVTIHTTTGDVVFVAVESDLIKKDEFPTDRVYGAVPAPVLRLITCGGSFDRKIGHYRSNVVVYLVPKVAP